jgi:hypothetical protein
MVGPAAGRRAGAKGLAGFDWGRDSEVARRQTVDLNWLRRHSNNWAQNRYHPHVESRQVNGAVPSVPGHKPCRGRQQGAPNPADFGNKGGNAGIEGRSFRPVKRG